MSTHLAVVEPGRRDSNPRSNERPRTYLDRVSCRLNVTSSFETSQRCPLRRVDADTSRRRRLPLCSRGPRVRARPDRLIEGPPRLVHAHCSRTEQHEQASRGSPDAHSRPRAYEIEQRPPRCCWPLSRPSPYPPSAVPGAASFAGTGEGRPSDPAQIRRAT
jgi:hypothetical protein